MYEKEREEKERQYQEHKLLMGRQAKLGIKQLKVTKVFTCRNCNRGFHKRKQYEKHLKIHLPLHQCPHCTFKTRNKKQFENHAIRHLKTNPKFECDLCQGRYATSALLRGHRGRHHGIFHCYHCSQECDSFEDRSHHMEEVHGVKAVKRKRSSGLYSGDNYIYELEEDLEGGDLSENVCDICRKQCRSRALLKAHVAQHLNVGPTHLSDDLEPVEKKSRLDPPDDSSDDSADEKVAYTPARAYKKRSSDFIGDEQVETSSLGKEPFLGVDSDFRGRYIDDPKVNLLARIKPASENAIFFCGNCNRHFPNPASLFWHAVTTHGFREFDLRRRALEHAEQTSGSGTLSDNNSDDRDGNAPSAELEKELVVGVVGVPLPSQQPGTTAVVGVVGVPLPSQQPGTTAAPRHAYECHICGPRITFRKATQLKKHLSSSHRKLRRCGECRFSSRHMMKVIAHQVTQHKEMFRCPSLCLRLFKTREEMLVHKEQMHETTNDANAASVTGSRDGE